MNEAAKKVVARAARAAGKAARDMIRHGADADEVCAQEWRLFAEEFLWEGAQRYFEQMFYNGSHC